MNDDGMKEVGQESESRAGKPWSLSDLVGLLVNQNPFYLISAAFVLYGLSAGFGTDDIWINTTIPLTILLGYSVTLAGIAFFLIRYGKVWNDVRSILVALMLIFFNVSAALDELLLRGTGESRFMALGVWLLVLAVVETLRRGIGVRWPKQFVLAFYVILTVILAYPSIPAHYLLEEQANATVWAIIAFPVLGAAALLLTRSSIRTFAKGDWCNGTPWRRLQLVMIVGFVLALLARTYLLATAFYPDPSLAVGGYHKLDTAFGGWLCAPILLAVLVLVLEYAMAVGSVRLRRAALFGAPSVVLIAMIGPDSAAFETMRSFMASELAAPPFLAGIGVLAFTGYACWKRVPEAGAALFSALLLFSPVGTETLSLHTIQYPHWAMLGGLTLGCLAMLWVLRHSVWFVGATAAFCFGLHALVDAHIGSVWEMVLVMHVILVALVVCACCFKDQLARFLTTVLALWLPFLVIVALWARADSLPDLHAGLRLLYAIAIATICFILQRRLNRDLFLGVNIAIALFGSCFLFMEFGNFLAELKLHGKGRIVLGLCSLVVALAISIFKARHFRSAQE